tara:strand:+ start:2232 stop:3725 length:1494 start_codon:yes stop_codon:yes gene_type:complete
MKKFVIVGSGSAGLISAAMIKKYWQDEVDISIIHNQKQGTIAVGESTTPFIHIFLNFFDIPEREIIRDLDVSVKLGINFKNWIPNTEYFHGFTQVPSSGRNDDPSSIYSILNDEYDGGSLYNHAINEVPSTIFNNLNHGLHIDTKQFTEYISDKLKNKVNFIDDIVTRVRVNSECDEIENIECKYSGIIEADYFIDASGFNTVLFKHLNPKWNDITKFLPIDRAIPQQVPYDFTIKDDMPSYTLAEATDNGWIWKIPIGNRFGTGYLYSSKFTSDDEAREKYNDWLVKNFNTELKTDRIIKYRPGYYENCWIGNCLAVGLASGFVEPLESTGIHTIIKQVQEFINNNSNLKNLKFNRKSVNQLNKEFYVDIIDFVALHYCTNRTDSEFWKYITNNKSEWVADVEQKCKEEFLDVTLYRNNPARELPLESYVSIAQGLKMFSKYGIESYLNSKPHGHNMFFSGQDILEVAKNLYECEQSEKTLQEFVSHKQIIDSIHK